MIIRPASGPKVVAALGRFLGEVKGAREFLQSSKGVLVFAGVIKAGVDGSVALIDIGAGKSIDTMNLKDPIVGFVVGQKGLMYNLTLEGSKVRKLKKT